MIISVGVVAYNEQNTLPKLFECIKVTQTYLMIRWKLCW